MVYQVLSLVHIRKQEEKGKRGRERQIFYHQSTYLHLFPTVTFLKLRSICKSKIKSFLGFRKQLASGLSLVNMTRKMGPNHNIIWVMLWWASQHQDLL
jgi:hypothetical protein